MKKSEFKKMMKKENKAFKNYYVYEIIIILLTMIMVVGNVFATSKNLILNNITIINSILIMIIAIPIILIDVKNDKDIKEMYQIYNKESKIPEYKDKTKSLKINLKKCQHLRKLLFQLWAHIRFETLVTIFLTPRGKNQVTVTIIAKRLSI